jgi:hypothetical protein
MAELLGWTLIACIAVNLVLIWYNFRSIRAYYHAHELLQDLCFHAWRMRDRAELLPLYQDSMGRAWIKLARRK